LRFGAATLAASLEVKVEMRAGVAPGCEQVADDLVLMLDGALAGWRAEAVNAHLEACARCARFYASLREQLVLHRWADEAFSFDDAEACLPEDLPDFARLSARLQSADLAQLGQVLYAILKAEFLHDYGDGLAAQQAPIADPRAERRRGAELVDELRDWHDADRVDGVDLRDVKRRMAPPRAGADRLDLLIQGMASVARMAPELAHPARYYQAMAHVKAARSREATVLLSEVVAGGPPPLVRIARICLATLPALLEGRPGDSLPALEACLEGDRMDAIVLYNLAKSQYLLDGRVGDSVRDWLTRAQAVDAQVVARQLALASEQDLRVALAEAG
jgi:hypothetical protein